MTHHVSDCCGARIFYDDDDVPICLNCGEECEAVKVPPDKDEVATVKTARGMDR